MIVGIIPARYSSSRFPGKALCDINGKTMIQRVYEQSKLATSLQSVVVATDDERIYDHVKGFGGAVVMTGASHQSGTDRCWDAVQQLDEAVRYVINIQGDEPFIHPQQIDELAVILEKGDVELATQMIAITDYEMLSDPGEVKIVLNTRKEALYFSRMMIPFIKGVPQEEWHRHHSYYRHVGMYAYRKDVLERIAKMGVSSLEQAESLEQLRWLENGLSIQCVETSFESHCIDTEADLKRMLEWMRLNNIS